MNENTVVGTRCSVGLQLPQHLSFEEWQKVVADVKSLSNASLWWVGDSLAFGQRQYGSMYKNALTGGQYDYQTLRNATWVASRIDVSRRRDKLSWSHHLEVAALEPDQQDALLRRAESEQMGREKLRHAVRELKRTQKRAQTCVHSSPTPSFAGPAKSTAQIRSEKSVARWIWGKLLAFEAHGALSSSADRIWAQMDSRMRTDVLGIAKRLVPWLQTMLEQTYTETDRMPAYAIGSRSLLERYGAHRLSDFFGLEKPRAVLSGLALAPRTTRLLFIGPPGTGKTSMGYALADEIPAELHHVPAKMCDLQRVECLVKECYYPPHKDWKPARAHLCIVDEADQMSTAAREAFLSVLDDTTRFYNAVIFIFTTNDATKLGEKFCSRCDPLEFTSEGISTELETKLAQVWTREGGDPASAPGFAKIVGDCGSNVRAAFNVLEVELLYARGKSASNGQKSGLPSST